MKEEEAKTHNAVRESESLRLGAVTGGNGPFCCALQILRQGIARFLGFLVLRQGKGTIIAFTSAWWQSVGRAASSVVTVRVVAFCCQDTIERCVEHEPYSLHSLLGVLFPRFLHCFDEVYNISLGDKLSIALQTCK